MYERLYNKVLSSLQVKAVMFSNMMGEVAKQKAEEASDWKVPASSPHLCCTVRAPRLIRLRAASRPISRCCNRRVLTGLLLLRVALPRPFCGGRRQKRMLVRCRCSHFSFSFLTAPYSAPC